MCIYTHVHNTETLVWQKIKKDRHSSDCHVPKKSVCHRFTSPDVACSVGTGGSFPTVKVNGARNRLLDLYLAPSLEAVLPLCHMS